MFVRASFRRSTSTTSLRMKERDTLTFNANIFIQTKSTIIIGSKVIRTHLCPFKAAWCRGVYPVLSTQFTFGPLQMLSKKRMHFLIYYQNIRLISEGSCDTEDWSNNRNTFHFTINSNRKQLYFNCNICHNVTAFTVFVIINTSTVSKRLIYIYIYIIYHIYHIYNKYILTDSVFSDLLIVPTLSDQCISMTLPLLNTF